MRPYDIYYYIQHNFLCLAFYKEKKEFINVFADVKGKLLFVLARDMLRREGIIDVPFEAEDFDVTFSELSDSISVCKVTFPEPEETALCYCVYMLYDTDFANLMYFTVEKSEDLSSIFGKDLGLGESYFLCGWSKEGAHLNFGTFDSIDKAYDKALEIYLKK